MRTSLLRGAGLFAGLAATVSASAVTDLTADTFDEFVNSHAVVMVEFFAPWCGVCKDLAPIYEATASELDASKDIRFARVDCVEDADLCKKYKTPIYPTIRLFQGEEKQVLYNGPRTPFEMTQYAERRYRPLVHPLTTETLDAFKTLDNVTAVAYIAADDSISSEIFAAVAAENIDYFAFGTITDAAAAKAAGVSQPGVVLHKAYDEGTVPYSGAFEQEAIDSFLETASIPLIAEIDKKYSYRYIGEDTPPLAGIIAETIEERAALAEMIRPIAAKHRSTLRFASIDPTAYRKLIGTFGVNADQSPAFGIRELSGEKYLLDPKAPLTAESVEKFVDSYLAGTLSQYFKSEPVPTSQEGPVTVVVRDTFQELVMDHDSDVLVEFYAPWCGHCKKLAPTYDRLAELYATHDPKVRLVKVDAAANEVTGHPVASFPTLKFFPKGDKASAVQYDGNRSIEDLADFIKKHSVGKVDISAFLADAAEAAAEAGETVVEKVEEAAEKVAETVESVFGNVRDEL